MYVGTAFSQTSQQSRWGGGGGGWKVITSGGGGGIEAYFNEILGVKKADFNSVFRVNTCNYVLNYYSCCYFLILSNM